MDCFRPKAFKYLLSAFFALFAVRFVLAVKVPLQGDLGGTLVHKSTLLLTFVQYSEDILLFGNKSPYLHSIFNELKS